MELIIAEFDRAHTAYLARAALARLQGQLALEDEDLVVVTRDSEERVLLCEPRSVPDGRARQEPKTFWNTLVHQLVLSGASRGAGRQAALARLAAVGINGGSERCLDQGFRAGSAALLALIDGRTTRDQVLGVLNGFQGRALRSTLNGDDRKGWQRALSGT